MSISPIRRGWTHSRPAASTPDFYTTRGFGLNELLPWDTISDGVSTGCLLRERERAYRSETTPDCRTACNGCGANCLLKGGRCDA